MAEDKDNKDHREATRTDAEALEGVAKREDERSASAADRVQASVDLQKERREALTEKADIGGVGASKMEASGAFVEDGAKKMIDVDHPAVDNNPRANTTEAQNRVDFNDPTLNDRQAVAQRLDDQD